MGSKDANIEYENDMKKQSDFVFYSSWRKQMDKKLKDLTIEERLKVMSYHFEFMASKLLEDPRIEYLHKAQALNLAIKLIQDDGWKQIAPAWVDDYYEGLKNEREEM